MSRLAVLLLAIAACSAESALRHGHHHRHQHQGKTVQKQVPETDNGWDPLPAEQIEEMKAAEDDEDPFQSRPEYGKYEIGITSPNEFEILDTPEKMDPDWQAKQHLNEVNKLTRAHSSADDDDDDDE